MSRMNQGRRGEEGMVAIIVATVVMVIMTLITLGFARMMQREQREALDKSLSTQAFYAAESGINDAVQKLQDQSAPYTGTKSSCDVSPTNGTPFTNGTIDSALGASYTCLMIDPDPPTLEFSPGRITTNTSTVFPLTSSNGNPITSVKIAWDPYPAITSPTLSTTVCSSPNPAFPSASAWSVNTPGMLRVDLVNVRPPVSRDSLANGMLSLYLYPANCGPTALTYGTTPTGTVGYVRCNSAGTRLCEATITTSAPNSAEFYMRLRSLYRNASVTVSGFNGASQLELSKAQTSVDSTGKVNDTIRRVEVRVPTNKDYPLPEFGAQSADSLCKQITVAPPSSVFGVGALNAGNSAGTCGL